MRKAILEGFPDANLGVSMVWINMLEGDTEAAARHAAAAFTGNRRVHQFHDAERRLGRHVAQVLGGESDAVAWDIYLFYEEGSTWTQELPVPSHWVHQLTTSGWAPSGRYFAGDDLSEELHQSMGRLLAAQGLR